MKIIAVVVAVACPRGTVLSPAAEMPQSPGVVIDKSPEPGRVFREEKRGQARFLRGCQLVTISAPVPNGTVGLLRCDLRRI
jgi:hypothetical protein